MQTPVTPIISVPSGTLGGPTQVTISSQTGVQTHYTTNNTTPTLASPAFLGAPLLINYSQTLQAVAFKNGVSSGTASATYTLDATQFPVPNGSDMISPSVTLQLPTNSQ
jgi:hypothetical protein